ncbi:hypothetical protein TTHERM_000985199 (macronuclear) [Tetrahymena thermophila SB210]|uniref:Uncharacterized protein n=1 Tax=Tetrahymena thermophila (strain SB210) TaxID=312017 RepID=W7XJD6_TETTS|nr:hypothetical protein TTHERM_000985199 [Tetrahymena thermophila SB210]EWS75436.1 hypothetical protein TTHERM_000985199 [Tetrahymena thermophila SB210]|eukprot:XP_012652021.1 hypothetical protein TTHERM_000985199 [Tetrahymena thermophila SB210]
MNCFKESLNLQKKNYLQINDQIIQFSQQEQNVNNDILKQKQIIDLKNEKNIIEIQQNNLSVNFQSDEEQEEENKNDKQNIEEQENELNINKKRKFDEFNDEEISQTQELDSYTEILVDVPAKKQSSSNRNKFEGPFEMKGFEWFEKNGLKYLKIIKNEIQDINLNCFKSKVSQKSDMGKQIHKLIKKYIDTENECVFDEFFNQEEKIYIKYQIDQTIKYLKLRGMDTFYTEKLLKSEQSQ